MICMFLHTWSSTNSIGASGSVHQAGSVSALDAHPNAELTTAGSPWFHFTPAAFHEELHITDTPDNKNALEQREVRQRSERIWRGDADVRSLWNRPFRLKIYITGCWLYSFRFAYANAA